MVEVLHNDVEAPQRRQEQYVQHHVAAAVAKKPFYGIIRTRIIELPPSIGGIALGSVGLAGTVRYAGDVYLDSSARRALDALAIPFYIVSAIYTIVMVLRICLKSIHKSLCTELQNPSAAAAHGPFVMALGLLSDALVLNLSNKKGDAACYIGVVGIYSTAVLQLLLMVVFLRTCWLADAFWPEPFWFPVTVSIAITGLVGGTVDVPRILMELSFWSGVLLTILLLPMVVYRTMRYSDDVTTNPTIAILMAPVSFVAITWFAMDNGSEWVGGDSDVFATILFSSSMAVFFLTMVAIAQRRRYICGKPFSGAWAAFTFPVVSTCKTALHFADRFYNDKDEKNNAVAQAFKYWSLVLSVPGLFFVSIVILTFTLWAILWPKGLIPAIPQAVENNSTLHQESSLEEEYNEKPCLTIQVTNHMDEACIEIQANDHMVQEPQSSSFWK